MGDNHLAKSQDGLEYCPDADIVHDGISPLAQEIIDDSDPSGGLRTYLLWGPSGTGKTGSARQAAKVLGGGSWITLEGSAAMSSLAWGLVHALRPRVIILDDPELAACDARIREGVREASGYASALIASANVVGGVRGSILRPGRFDREHHVASTPREVLDAAGAGLPPEVLDAAHCAGLVAAYVSELAYQWHKLGMETLDDARGEIASLTGRMERAGDS